MQTRNWGLALLPCLALLSGCAIDASGEEGSIESKSQKLVGGAPVAQGKYRATVWMNQDCSATKVGENVFLTAAHCVERETSGELAEEYGSGSSIELRWQNEQNQPVQGTFTIIETLIHESWGAQGTIQRTHAGMADIALVRVDGDTPGIPRAQVEVGEVLPGHKVVKVGYGCQERTFDGNGNAIETGHGLLKTEEGWTVRAEESAPPGFQFKDGFEPIRESYLITSGAGRYSGFASICTGDSGGPLYLGGLNELRVVGVNSDYTYSNSAYTWADWHTRTSLSSRHGIGFWLANHGVDIVWSDVSRGTITFERWNNIGGTSLSQIPTYRPPQEERNIDRFEIYAGQSQNGDNYGVRMRGYLIPPQSGTYVFSIAGDDNVELRLSSGSGTPAQRIAHHNGYTGVRQWNKYSTQRSQPIYLHANHRYYIEAQMKEGGGQDHLAVGWNLPNQHGSPPQVIEGAYLEPAIKDPYDSWACSCAEGCDSIIVASVPGSFENPLSGCFFFENLGSSINSYGMETVNLNGQDITNSWRGNWQFPSRRDGGYYLYVEGQNGSVDLAQ